MDHDADAATLAHDGREAISPTLEAIAHMPLAEVRRLLEQVLKERFTTPFSADLDRRFIALCRREVELLRATHAG